MKINLTQKYKLHDHFEFFYKKLAKTTLLTIIPLFLKLTYFYLNNKYSNTIYQNSNTKNNLLHIKNFYLNKNKKKQVKSTLIQFYKILINFVLEYIIFVLELYNFINY